jgi:hypothetical protein
MEYHFTCGQKVKDDRHGNGVVEAVTSSELGVYFQRPTIPVFDGKTRVRKMGPMRIIYQLNNDNSIKHLSVI